jgi:hypothetical protein
VKEVTVRIEGGARAPGADGGDPSAARFGDALARAGGTEWESGRAEARARERVPLGGPRRAGGPAEPPRRPGEEARPTPPVDARGAASPVEVLPAAELARAIRVVPPAAAILGPAGGAPLTLSFGRSLDVDLRATSAGVDVVLRPEPALVRAAEAELPRLVAALRVRGVAVARVEVRPRAPSGGRPR